MTDPRMIQDQQQHLAVRGCDTALPATESTKRRDCGTLLRVTSRPPGAGRNNPLAITTAAEIQAQESPFLFTCTFPGKCIAIVQVYGAQSRDDARTAVQSYWQQCQYTVTDGDGGRSHVAPFILMVKRHANLLRFEADQSQGEKRETEL